MILHIAQSNLTRNPQPHVLLQMDDDNMATTHRSPLCPGVTETCRCGFRPSGTPRPVLVNPNLRQPVSSSLN
jgi:hypothetical protein